jgi:hypothetical protein
LGWLCEGPRDGGGAARRLSGVRHRQRLGSCTRPCAAISSLSSLSPPSSHLPPCPEASLPLAAEMFAVLTPSRRVHRRVQGQRFGGADRQVRLGARQRWYVHRARILLLRELICAFSGGSVTNRYTSVMKGFSATIPDSFITQLQSLESDGVVDYIGTPRIYPIVGITNSRSGRAGRDRHHPVDTRAQTNDLYDTYGQSRPLLLYDPYRSL